MFIRAEMPMDMHFLYRMDNEMKGKEEKMSGKE